MNAFPPFHEIAALGVLRHLRFERGEQTSGDSNAARRLRKRKLSVPGMAISYLQIATSAHDKKLLEAVAHLATQQRAALRTAPRSLQRDETNDPTEKRTHIRKIKIYERKIRQEFERVLVH